MEVLCKVMKTVLGNKVEKVFVSNSLLDYPCCIVTSQYCLAANKKKIIVLLELGINPDHEIILEMCQKVHVNPYDKSVKDWVNSMFTNSLVASGLSETEPSELKRANFAELDNEVFILLIF